MNNLKQEIGSYPQRCPSPHQSTYSYHDSIQGTYWKSENCRKRYVLGYGQHLYGRRGERTQPSGVLLICTNCKTTNPFLLSLYPCLVYDVPSHFCSKRHRICKQHPPSVHIRLLHTSCRCALKSLAHQTSLCEIVSDFVYQINSNFKSFTVIRTLLHLGPCPQ